MNQAKKILHYVGVFLVVITSLWLLLIGAAMISNNQIRENMEKSAYSYNGKEAFAFCDGTKWNGIADNYADSIWLNVAWYMGKDNPARASLDTKYYDGEEAGENAGLLLAVTDDSVEANTEYTRYWHGTAGIVRLLHLVTDVNGIKSIGIWAAAALVAVVVLLLIKEQKTVLAVGFLVALCGIEIWKIGLCIEYQPAFLICFLMCILYLKTEKKGDDYIIGLSVVGGVLTAFFDFLTTETVTLLVPLILVIVMRSLDRRLADFKESLIWIIRSGVAWGLSYAGIFLMKWILASLVIGENQFLSAMLSVEERVAGATEEVMPPGIIGQRISAVVANLSALFGAEARVELPLALVGTGLFLGAVCSVFYLFQKKERDKTATRLLLILGNVVFVRFLVLGNHSYLHSFFTYRALLSTLLAAIGILVVNCQLPLMLNVRKKQREKKK